MGQLRGNLYQNEGIPVPTLKVEVESSKYLLAFQYHQDGFRVVQTDTVEGKFLALGTWAHQQLDLKVVTSMASQESRRE